MTQRRPTSFDIAALAGVSQPTVSRALSGSSSVSDATRARVLAAAEQLNYKVDKNASGLRRRQSRTLAALFFEEWAPRWSAYDAARHYRDAGIRTRRNQGRHQGCAA